MMRTIWRIRGALCILRVCRHGQFTTKARRVGDRMYCHRCAINQREAQ